MEIYCVLPVMDTGLPVAVWLTMYGLHISTSTIPFKECCVISINPPHAIKWGNVPKHMTVINKFLEMNHQTLIDMTHVCETGTGSYATLIAKICKV